MSKIAFAGPAIMEFGWEIMTWQAYLRKLSHNHGKMIISTFEGMEPLYVGFHCEVEFLPHKHPGRALEWRDVSMVETGFDATQYTIPVETIAPIKQFRVEGEFVRYGTPFETDIEILFHARGIQKASFKNYAHAKWNELASSFPKAASVGSEEDYHIPGTIDKRGIPLQELMDLMASSQVIVGQSSGVMHLATLCGLRQVVWGDNKTYFSETLERRYKEIWNPFDTPVTWIPTDAWNPETKDVMQAMLDGSESVGLTAEILHHMKQAGESGRYLISITRLTEKDGKGTLESFCQAVGLPPDKQAEATAQSKQDMDNLLKKITDELLEKGGVETGEGADTPWRLTP